MNWTPSCPARGLLHTRSSLHPRPANPPNADLAATQMTKLRTERWGENVLFIYELCRKKFFSFNIKCFNLVLWNNLVCVCPSIKMSGVFVLLTKSHLSCLKFTINYLEDWLSLFRFIAQYSVCWVSGKQDGDCCCPLLNIHDVKLGRSCSAKTSFISCTWFFTSIMTQDLGSMDWNVDLNHIYTVFFCCAAALYINPCFFSTKATDKLISSQK